MAQLIYSAITSLDGYVVDADGNFDWAAPDDQVHAEINEQERPIGTYLYGRRMYEIMRYWQTADAEPGGTAVGRDFARIWQAADKVVYSSTLDEDGVTTERTTLERTFDPESVRDLKESATKDLSIGGPTVATAAISAGLVDEYRQFVTPVVVGGGTSWLPDGVRIDLELLDQRRFDGGVVYLRYRPLPPFR